MPKPRAEIGEVWFIRGLGRRVIVAIDSDRHGRLYGVRAPTCDYPLTPVYSRDSNRGRFVRSRSLIRRDKRKRHVNLPFTVGSSQHSQQPCSGHRDSLPVEAALRSAG